MRALRGYRRNEKSPFRALTPKAVTAAVATLASRNEKSPFRALTPPYDAKSEPYLSVEMKKARSGR